MAVPAAPQATASAPATVVVAPPAAPEEAAATPPEAVRPPLAEILAPDPAACRFSAEQWSFADLRLSAAGARFATVVNAPATLIVPVASPASGVVAEFGGDVAVRLVARADELALYEKSAHALLGILVPESRSSLALAAASPGAVEVTFDARDVLASPTPVRDTLGCGDVGIVSASYDARAAVTKRAHLPTRWIAHDGVAIARERGGAAVAAFADGVEVGVIETRGAASRVIAEGPGYVVAGWVATRDLANNATGGVGYGTGSGGLGATGLVRVALPSCAHDLALIGEIGSERAVVGGISKGTPYRLPAGDTPARDEPDGLVPVELPYSTWLELARGARLLVRARELSGCR